MGCWMRGALLWSIAGSFSPLWAYVDLVTRWGELWRTVDATNWIRVAQMGYPDPAGYLPGTPAWLLTAQGDLLRSLDEGQTWQAVAAYPFQDGVAFLYEPTRLRYYALTRSGEVWRGSAPDSMSRVGSLPIHDGKTLAALSGLSPVLLVLTRSGDVYTSTDEGGTWQQVGNTGFGEMQAMGVKQDTLYALTLQGDVLRSADTGRTWTVWSTLSHVGSADLLIDGVGQMFAVLETSELLQYDTASASWTWLGSPSQIGVVILAQGGGATLEQENPRRTLPFRVRVVPGGVWLEGPEGSFSYTVLDATGRRVAAGVGRGGRVWIRLPSTGRYTLRAEQTSLPIVVFRP